METTASGTGAALQLILTGFSLLLGILFLLTQQNTLRTIRTENRRMAPGLVWLQVIPLFGQVWQFIVVSRISGSIRNEIASWENDSILGGEAAVLARGNGHPTLGIGITYCSLCWLYVVLIVATLALQTVVLAVPMALVTLALLVCWIVYWVNLAGYRRRLREKNLATL